MELKLFGKKIFEFNKSSSLYYINSADEKAKQSKFLPDFYSQVGQPMVSDFAIIEASSGRAVAVPIKDESVKTETHKSPKDIYDLKMLNEQGFQINTNEDYVEQQIGDFKEKLNLVKTEEFDMSRGLTEISSILMRLENRKKYSQFKDFFEEYPYTTTVKIDNLVKSNSYLKLGQLAQFVADMPSEAISEMKKYTQATEKLCKKKPVYYIIADKKDFEKSNKRRDPILLAQSPFGHFWQILGAWDKEMLLLENL
jgi:hypothetical protein